MLLAAVLWSASSDAVAQGTQIQGPRNAADVYSGVVYGPIDQSDTLWAISSQYRKNQQFTVYQVMLAIYELNPRSFVNRNFNTMVNGSMLQLPTDRYIARIDPQRARAKAEQDDRTFTASTGRKGSGANEANAEQPSAENIKPDIPLVNKDELDSARKQFQQQINSLKRQQSTLVNEFKQQLGESIQATQAIVDENKLVLEQLAKKDEEFVILKTELSEDFQNKLDEQDIQIQELREFVRLAQLREQQEKESSFGSLIRDPLFIIIVTSIAGLLIFLLIAMLLLRKPATQKVGAPVTESDADNIVLDDSASHDSDELLAMLESDDMSDDDLLDDILSDELEESIDEVALDTDDFEEIDDEMLVPDKKDKKANDELEDALLTLDDEDDGLDEELLDLDFDGLDLDDDDIDLDAEDISLDGSDDPVETDSEPEEVDIDSILDEQSLDFNEQEEVSTNDTQSELSNDETATETLQEDDDEQSEISIDDLLTQNSLDSDLPEGISLNEEGEIDENVIEQIEAEVSDKNTEINTLTNSFTEELQNTQLVEDELDAEDLNSDDIDISKTDSQKSIQPLDQLTEGVEDDIADAIANAEQEALIDELESDDLDDPLSDELLSELNAEQADSGFDADLDEVLSEPHSETDADDSDVDPNIKGSLDNLQTGTIEFEQHEELDDALDASLDDGLIDDELLEVEGVPLDIDSDTASDEPENIDIDAVLDDSLNDLLNNQSDSDEDFDLEENNLDLDDDKSVANDEAAFLVDEVVEEAEKEDAIKSIEKSEDQQANESDESEDIDDIIADLEGDEVIQNEVDSLSEEMLSELDSTEELDGIDVDIDDIALGELADLDSHDLPSLEADDESEHDESSLVLDDIPSLASEGLTQQAEHSFESELESKQEASEETSELDSLNSELSEIDPDASKLESSDDDILDLPDLDDWLEDDDDDTHTESKGKFNEALENFNSNESEDDVLREIEEADFDSLLQEMGSLDDEQTAAEIEKLAIDDEHEPAADIKDEDGDSEALDNPDLDLTALFDESAQDNDKSKGFIDVDSLLQESENLTPATDEELVLDLDMSLDKFLNDDTAIDVDVDADQASNLDLARVYMDMEDNEAAIESLEEVLEKGTDEQKMEAKALIEQLKE